MERILVRCVQEVFLSFLEKEVEMNDMGVQFGVQNVTSSRTQVKLVISARIKRR